MEDRDYFLQKQIEQLTEMLSSLIADISNCKDKTAIHQAFEVINQRMMSTLNINLEEIANVPVEHFIATITVDNFIDNHNLDLLAELFYYSGKAYICLKDKEMAKRMFLRSLTIYKFLLKVETDFTYERHLRIKELNEILYQ
jgi:hypothetical protein